MRHCGGRCGDNGCSCGSSGCGCGGNSKGEFDSSDLDIIEVPLVFFALEESKTHPASGSGAELPQRSKVEL